MKKCKDVTNNKLDPKNWQNLPNWDDLPDFMRVPEVKPYYDILKKRKWDLKVKRIFDISIAGVMIVLLALPMGLISVAIKLDSPGAVLYRQERVTTYGKIFRIHKFRTMVNDADQFGTAVTVLGDTRITKVGFKLRKLRLDELPQLFDVFEGTMSFVGTRPEVVRYVKKYSPEMMATLLMPAGITSEASIRYKDEAGLLNLVDDVDTTYVTQVMPEKMKWNLRSIKHFRFFRDILIMFRTVLAVMGRD